MKLPDEARERALALAYEEFDKHRWEQAPPGERGAVFEALTADPAFSDLLRPYLSTAQMRVWIKDSAAKEYPRALEGVGRTAQFTKRRYPGPEAIARSALGDGWTVVGGSVKTKPMRCDLVGVDGERKLLLWGPVKGLRDLHWAASGVRAAGGGRVGIALTRPSMAPVPDDEWKRAQSLCDLIGADLYSVMYVPRTGADT